jgi:hypothetical protein
MTSPDYTALFDEALADVETGVLHPCGTSPSCAQMGGCPRCFAAVMSGADIGVAAIEVFTKAGIVRLTMSEGCGKPQPCVVSFRNVPLTIHGESE